MAGYSHRSLRDKLGIKPGMQVYVSNMPPDVWAELGDVQNDTTVTTDERCANYLHYFISTSSELVDIAERVQQLEQPQQMFWISWPKKASKIPTDVTEQTLRDVLLPTGLVDVKVCAVSEVYSGLKFVWRKK
ncbi:hypothetical protein [Mycobacterium sp. M26]|uniref:hypothetical protein n=1 Tax=Mycobacterium sp. M26 TaxID=1762962 RepID=UPI00073EF667|nr:hypothetical protein [Mycobacterium sp. M26]